jgi:hypothetical protein
MLNVEQLTAHVQGALLGVIQTARKQTDVPLLLVASVKRDADSLLSSGLRKDWVSCEQHQLLQYCLPVCAAFLKKELPQVKVYRSATACSGKTTAVIRDHLKKFSSVTAARAAMDDEVDGSEFEGLEFEGSLESLFEEGFFFDTPSVGSPVYASISITGDADEAVEVLRAVEANRLALSALEQQRWDGASLDADAGGLLLHLNVSSHFDVAKLNRFLLSFLLTGVLTDSKGGHIVRYATDTVAIEWPSEGVLADHAWGQCRLLSCFDARPVHQEFHLEAYTFNSCLPAAPDMDCTLYHLFSWEDPQLRVGLPTALLCVALRCFALLCVALRCFALLCAALCCFALLCVCGCENG